MMALFGGLELLKISTIHSHWADEKSGALVIIQQRKQI
jgi:hypothetical protein